MCRRIDIVNIAGGWGLVSRMVIERRLLSLVLERGPTRMFKPLRRL
jgi:hypothetical protein